MRICIFSKGRIIKNLSMILCAAVCSSAFAQDTEIHEKKKFADLWSPGKLIANIRSYYMNRHFKGANTQESMALGGWFGLETPKWLIFSAGAVIYTSQGIFFTDKKRDGASLLAPGQKGYTVLGQAYLNAEIEKNTIRLYRQEIETPFINRSDFRMTPKTFEAYTFASNLIDKFKIMVSHVTKIKGWNYSKFVSMSEDAGFHGTNEPVTLGGVIFTPNDKYKLQLWNYYCHEFMNVVYAQGDANWKIRDELCYTLSLQGFDQRDVENALGGTFHTGMFGCLAGINWHGLNPTIGFTITNDNHDIVNPWGSYPGYTSIIEEDCDLAGEKAWVLGLAYDFSKIGIRGLSAFINHTQSYIPPGGWFSRSDQEETDLTVDYHFSGNLDGLWLRFRTAIVKNSLDVDSKDYEDFRVIVNYSF